MLVEPLESRLLLSRDWFVAPWGQDANPGTLAAPLQTIQRAANLAQAGDTVLIRGGTYRETVTPANSGTAVAPITYEAYNNEPVVISGADPVSGWSNYGGSIFRAAQVWDLGAGNNQVFVDGQMINEARWPNTSLDVSHPTFATASAAFTISPGTGWLFPSTATIDDPSLPGAAGAWVGATIHVASGQGWVVQTGTVLSSTPGELTFAFQHFTSYEIPTAGNRFYLTGTFRALDAPGEWYRDPTTGQLYVWTPSSDSPAAHLIEAKHRLYAFELSGRSYINLQGLRLFASTIDTDAASNHLTIGNINAQYVSQEMLNPIPWDGHNRGASTGIILNGSNNVLQDSTIAYSSGDGVFVGGSDNVVWRCNIHDVDYAGGDEAGIVVSGARQKIVSNTIYNAGRDGIHDTFSSAGRITWNMIHDVGLQTTDLGGIYDWGTNAQGTVIAYNWVYNIHAGGFGAGGVYLDNGSSGYQVYSNLIWNVDHPLKINPPAYNNLVYSNVTAGGASQVAPPSAPANATGSLVTDLGTFSGFTSEANAINNAGLIVGGNTTGTAQPAFLEWAGVSYNMGTLGGTYSTARGVSQSGQVVGAAYPATGARHAFLYNAGRMTDLGTLTGDVGSSAQAINSYGQIVGTSYNAGAIGHAFLWSGGSMQPLGTLGGTISAAFGINDYGLIVGASTLAGDRNAHAFVRWNGRLWDMGTLGGDSSYALAVNNRGQIVGQSLIAGDAAVHAFVYQNGRMQDLGALPGLPNTVATAINNNGDIVGYAYDNNYYTYHAFLYRNGVMYDLNNLLPYTGWTLSVANGINDQDQIVGGGANPSGYHRAFLVRI